jgi:hypothetical protein
MFTVENAVNNWKLQLNQRQTMTPADIEEMETHLRDEMETLQSAGLSEEEAFLVASRRIGDCDQVAGEFAKINTTVIWRNRFFWMIGGILSAHILSAIAASSTQYSLVFLKYEHLPLNWFWTGLIAPLVSALVLLGLGWGLYRLIPRSSLWRVSARAKVLLIVALGLGVVVFEKIFMLVPLAMIRTSTVQDYGQYSLGSTYAMFVLSLIWPLMLAALLIFLMPGRTRKA